MKKKKSNKASSVEASSTTAHSSKPSAKEDASSSPTTTTTTTTKRSANKMLVGLDLGGSLSKIAVFVPNALDGKQSLDMDSDSRMLVNFIRNNETYGNSGVRENMLSFTSTRLNGSFLFIRYETSRTPGAIQLLKSLTPRIHLETIHATGGGAMKFSKLFEEELGVKLVAEDELETVVRGIVFTVMENPNTCYTVDPASVSGFHTEDAGSHKRVVKVPRPLVIGESLFPLLVVNIGSGVSIVKVDSPEEMRRVSGTAVGGGTYFGLCKLLTRCETFDEAMDMADRGDSRRVNMLVSDIYGGDYDRVGLPGTVTASFFGKAATAQGASRPASSGSHEDVIEARRERLGPRWVQFLKATVPLHIPVVLLACLAALHWGGETAFQAFAAGVLLLAGAIQLALHLRRRKKRNGAKLSPVSLPFNANKSSSSTDNRTAKSSSTSSTSTTQEESVFRDEDIARALVTMVAQNVTQLAYLNAKLHQTKRIIFTGNFLRHNTIALRTLTTNLRIWSGGEVEAIFTEHEGFFGAIGAFLRAHDEEEKAAGNVKGGEVVSSRGARGTPPTAPLPEGGGVLPPVEEMAPLERRSSFSFPKEGDDVFHVATTLSPQQHTAGMVLAEMAELRLT